jgi:hypothetical protein
MACHQSVPKNLARSGSVNDVRGSPLPAALVSRGIGCDAGSDTPQPLVA